MKIVKQVLILISLVFLIGCGNEKIFSEKTSKITEIQEAGVLNLATSADYAPYEWHLVEGGKDKIVGFDIDIAQIIADELGVELHISDLDFDGLIPALSTGKADLIISGMTPTAKRAESVDFSDIYISQEDVVVVREEDMNQFNHLKTMDFVSWATQKATVQEEWLQTNYPDSDIQSVGQWGTAIVSLKTGKVDAILMVKAVAEQYVKQNEDLVIADIKEIGTQNDSAIAIRKGDTDLKNKVNEIIDSLNKSDMINTLYIENTELMDKNIN